MNDITNTSNPTNAAAAQNAQAAEATGNDVTAGIEGSLSAGQQAASSADTAAATSLENDNENATKAYVADFSPEDTTPERLLMGSLRGYRLASEERFKHLLTGMANTTAEVLRCIAEAENHLADHIAQQETPKS